VAPRKDKKKAVTHPTELPGLAAFSRPELVTEFIGWHGRYRGRELTGVRGFFGSPTGISYEKVSPAIEDAEPTRGRSMSKSRHTVTVTRNVR